MSVQAIFLEGTNALIATVPNGRTWKIHAMALNLAEVFLSYVVMVSSNNSAVHVQHLLNPLAATLCASIGATPGQVGETTVFSLPDIRLPAGAQIILGPTALTPWNATLVIED